MKNNNIDKINELEEKIKLLPQGSIGKKSIKGNIYYYHRYNENGKRIEKYIEKNKIKELEENINQRKILEKELKELHKSNITSKDNTSFYSSIRIGEELKKFVNNVKNYKKRELFNEINNYIYSDLYDKVLVLYGLRRTGKTTLIRQTILEMKDENFIKTAFIQIRPNDTLGSINKDLKKLETRGYKYIFIDEVTLMEDFIEGAALFSDIYASSEMKIILSGTDSLGFMITKSEQLYDRCILLHTTLIPYKEFENVLNIKGIDEYIRYGGTMSLSGVNYNCIFKNNITTNEYVDSAIAKNLQHSLRFYNDGNHFRHLQELYENNELTNVINRVVEDINHKFTKEVLIKEFKSNDLALSSRNLRNDKNKQITILDDIDKSTFNYRLKQLLEILNKDEQTINLNEIHASEIKEYLKLLDVIYEIDEKSFPNINDTKKHTIISQPGLRYSQATALIDTLLLDEQFNDLSLTDKKYVQDRILSEIKGRMMEDIVLLETKVSKYNKEVFKLKFAIGEFDMVVFDEDTLSCEIYEIKYSKEIVKDQYKHLIDQEKINLTEFKYGKVKNKYVIYRGESKTVDDINYINVEEYLKSI